MTRTKGSYQEHDNVRPVAIVTTMYLCVVATAPSCSNTNSDVCWSPQDYTANAQLTDHDPRDPRE